MALPIAPTPMLSGKDSELFNKSLKKGLKKKVSKDEVRKMTEIMNAVLKNATFPIGNY